MIKNIINKMASSLGVGLVSTKRLEQLPRIESDTADLFNLILTTDAYRGISKAQLHQDIMVLLSLNFKRGGFFVEFGATNGIDLSNTYLLETKYDWEGILSEPATVWQEDLTNNRNVSIDFSCVWNKSNEVVSFNMVDSAELSTITEFNDSDNHAQARTQGVTYDVDTISLEDLLIKYDAPQQIDYLSIDTEGSEFHILNNFDFSKYDIKIITCEHNYTENRDKIFNLLSSKGFTRKFTGISKWDDWYFKD